MRIAEYAIKNPQLTLIGFALLVALGVTSFLAVPRSEDPHFPIPTYTVVAVYPGGTPEDLEELVAKPLEDAFRQLDDIKHVTADIRDSVAFLRIDFHAGVNSDDKYQEVLREVERARSSMPAQLARLEVKRVRTSDVQILQLALVSETESFHSLRTRADDLVDQLERVPGVRSATTWAAPEREAHVQLDLPRLAELNIPVGRVLQILEGDNRNIPSGTVESGAHRFSITTNARFRRLEDISNAVIAGGATGNVHLGDVARVEWGYEPTTHIARYNGKRAVLVTAQLKDNQDIFRVRDAMWKVLDTFSAGLPRNVALERGFDQSRNVQDRLSRLYFDFGLAIALVLLTLLPLGFRAAGLVMLSIPLSLATGLVLLKLTGFGLNQLSIVGFVIALGLVVDDSIVVVENIARFLREGHSPIEAAIRASKQIGLAVLGCTITLVLAFVPLLMLPGGAGDYIRSLPAAVVFAVAGSLLVSLTIVPFFASRFLRAEHDEHGNWFLRQMNRLIEGSYARVLKVAVARPRTTLALAGVLFVASLGLIPVVGFSLFPKAGIPQFMVTIEAPDGSSLAETDRGARFAEQVLRRHREIAGVFTNVGHGNPQVYYNVISRAENDERAELFVQLRRFDPKTTPQFLEGLRRELATYRDADIRVKEFENGPPIDAPIAIRIYGDELDELDRLAAQVEQTLLATPGTRDVDNPVLRRRTNLELAVDRERAGRLGVPTAEIVRNVRLGVAGLELGSVQTDAGDEFPIRVQLPRQSDQDRPTFDLLANVYVSSVAGPQLPLREVASLPFKRTPTQLTRRDGERVVTVTAQVEPGYTAHGVTQGALERLARVDLPPGYRVELAGEAESQAESFGGLGTAVVFAVFAILAVLVWEFRTFKSTLVVATVIPLGVVGGIAFLWLFGYSLSFTAAVGFIALIGIEIKNSILLVDFTNQLREQGLSIDDAVRRAGEIRFLPIVLTTLTALGGLVPLALQDSALYSPLAVVIMGGLITSTLLARLVTPAAYRLLAPSI